jgi:hypothetical protein
VATRRAGVNAALLAMVLWKSLGPKAAEVGRGFGDEDADGVAKNERASWVMADGDRIEGGINHLTDPVYQGQ